MCALADLVRPQIVFGPGRRRRTDGRLAPGHLMTAQNSDGGWGRRASDPSDPISTSYALLATRRWPSTPAHRQGVGYLLTRQRDDGGFSSRPDQAAPRPLPYDVPVLADICALWALNQRTVEGDQ
ncbi:prenyltransferase/squalene oxidase repeat-containing protein [Streptomyces sp. GbtcB6]|uniref:prenyltransferase/squalene oxidase repeat-containing protein n=1 Tax=Streptomyces sp. GbtcB6 TaxID=2824751 RepID=UPI0027E3F972|nr:prenyltransferase/squalene oxidase repeat-containing protein [Streptomyces sp. GbtcB6]